MIFKMIKPFKNLKIVNGFYSISKLTPQRYCVNGFNSLCCSQEINNFYYKNVNNICRQHFVPVETSAINSWNQHKSYTRQFANFSSKGAGETNLRKKNDTEGGDSGDKEMPEQEHGRTLPRLMNFPEIMWPSMINSIKNWIIVQFIIRPYLDREFNIRDFCLGAKKAMQVVSSRLMNGDFQELDNLVTSEALEELKPVVQKLSVSQRRQLEVKDSDIYLTFPYEVGIMFDEKNDKIQKRFVEITMVFHVLRGLKEMRESGEEIPWNMGILPEYQDRVFVCNYRFIKEFTKGHESDWTVNVVNHFKPMDLLNEINRG